MKVHPDLYYNPKYGENDPERKFKVGKAAFAEARLRCKDPRFRLSLAHMFNLDNSKVKREISSGIYQTMNVKKIKKK